MCDQHVNVLLNGIADEKFQLAGLVAARGKASAVVPFDEQARAAEFFAQAQHWFDRGRLVAQIEARITVKVDLVVLHFCGGETHG